MRTKQILAELKPMLSEMAFARLEFNTDKRMQGDISLCTVVANIIRDEDVPSNQEKQVCELLSALCVNHFKKPYKF